MLFAVWMVMTGLVAAACCLLTAHISRDRRAAATWTVVRAAAVLLTLLGLCIVALRAQTPAPAYEALATIHYPRSPSFSGLPTAIRDTMPAAAFVEIHTPQATTRSLFLVVIRDKAGAIAADQLLIVDPINSGKWQRFEIPLPSTFEPAAVDPVTVAALTAANPKSAHVAR